MAAELFPVNLRVQERRWMIPGLLPAGEVVLLDGATGVGKSALCARWMAEMSQQQQTRPSPRPMLYFSSDDQADLRDHFLATQGAYEDGVFDADFQVPTPWTPEGEPKPSYVKHLLAYIKEQVTTHQPLLVVFDSLEDLLTENGPTEPDVWRNFWRSLRQLAKTQNCTIIMTRRQGLHEPRQYGDYTRIATEMIYFILTMHWHPIHPHQRVISIARNMTGCLGEQFHLSFDAAGSIAIRRASRVEHVRPAKSPQTWQPDPDHLHQSSQIADEVEKLMGNQPTRSSDLKETLREQGYSGRVIQRALALMKLECRNVNGLWMYLPTQDESREVGIAKTPTLPARTRGAEVVVSDVRMAG